MKKILSLCAGFVAGIFLSTFFPLSLLWFWIILALVLFTDGYFESEARHMAFILGFVSFGIFLGLVRVTMFNHSVSHALSLYENKKVTLIGEILTDPVSNGSAQKFTVEILNVGTTTPVSGRIAVTADLFPKYSYGDVVKLSGTLKPPQKISETDATGNERVFDYPAYLLKDKITETMSFARVTETGENDGNGVLKFLYGFRRRIVSSVARVLPEPESGLLSGITFGTQTLGNDVNDQFRVAGLSHVVVLSGYNITIVAEAVMDVFLFVSVSLAPFAALLAVLLFVLMSGAGASAVRAGIMVCVAILGKRFGKSYDAGRALFLSAFLMIIWNPMILISDPSFHLSFLATFALVYISPFVEEKVAPLFQKFFHLLWLEDILATTLAVNIFVLPYLVFMSGNLSIYSVPANLLVLPFVPVTMLLGSLVALSGFISQWFAYIPAFPVYLLLRFDLLVTNLISHLPLTQIAVGGFSLTWMIVVYLAYVGIYYFFVYKKSCLTLPFVSHEVISEDGYIVIEG